MTTNNESANVVLTADVDGYSQNLQQAEQQTNSLIHSLDALTGKLSALGKMGSKGIQIIGTGTLAGIGVATKQAADFEKQMSVLRATSVTTGPAIGKIETSVLSLSRAFPIARSEAIGLVTQLTNLGVKSQSSIQNLSTTMVKLSGTTGESLSGLTQSFVELSRSMGTLDSNSSQKYANSLFTVSRNAGVAAGSVLSFSNAIAPMARMSGIGQRELMGISTAFAKAGADGFAGASTMNTMLADITRQIQYGSPQLRKYSDLIGVTVDQFKNMDRTEAVTQIFEAIGKQGPNAVKILDQMGFDGIRAARAITAVSQGAGGLRKAIEDSVGSFNGGNLEKASASAFGGLNDEMHKTKESLAEIGLAIGSTMLGPLTQVAKVAAGITGSLSGMAGFLKPLGNILVPITAAIAGISMIGMGKITGAATARYLMDTQTVRSVRAGSAAGRAAAGGGLIGPQTAAIADTQRRFAMGPGMRQAGGMNGLQRFLYSLSQANGADAAANGGPNIVSRTAAQMLRPVTWWQNTGRDFYRDAVKNPFDRTAGIPNTAALSGGNFTTMGGIGAAMKESTANLAASASAAAKSLMAGGQGAMGFGEAAKKAGLATVQMASAATRASFSLAGMAGRGAIGAIGKFAAANPLLAAVGVGLGAYTAIQNDRNNTYGDSAASNGLTEYNEKLGIASNGLSSFSTALKNAEESLPKPQSQTDALAVSKAQQNAALAPGRTLTNDTVGSLKDTGQGLAYLRSMGKMTPEQTQGVMLDLIQQFGPSGADKIATTYKKAGPSSTRSGASGLLDVARSQDYENGKGWGNVWEMAKNSVGLSGSYGENARKTLNTAYGAAFNNAYRPGASSAEITQRALVTVQQLIGKSFGKGGTLEEREASLQELKKRGIETNLGRFETSGMNTKFNLDTANMTDAERGQYIASHYFTKKTKDSLKDQGIKYGTTTEVMLANAKKLTKPEEDQVGNDLSRNRTALSSVLYARQAVVGREGDANYANLLTEKIANQGKSAMMGGTNAAQVIGELQAMAVAAGGSEKALAELTAAAIPLIQQFRSLQQLSMTRGEARAENYKFGAIALQNSDKEMRAQGRGAIMDQYSADHSFLANTAATLRSYNKGKQRYIADFDKGESRFEEDFDTSKKRGARDFARSKKINEREFNISVTQQTESFFRQREYAQSDFDKSIERATADHNLAELNAIEDNNTAKARANRDFQKSETRSIDDFNKSRARSQADFDKSMARRAEAAARSIYDPFKRVTTMQTMDTQNMLINLNKQTKLISDQKKNLDSLLAAGVSQDVIDTLNLSDSSQAQQLSRMVSDLKKTPSMVGDLNSSVSARKTATTGLVNSDTNVDYRQQKADFTLSLDRSVEDFTLALERNRKDFGQSMDDMAKDFDKNMARNNAAFTLSIDRATQDFVLGQARSLLEWTISMTASLEAYKRQMKDAQDAYDIQIADAEKDHKKQLYRMEVDYQQGLARMEIDLLDTFKDMNGSINELGTQALDLLQKAGVKSVGVIKSQILDVVGYANAAYSALGADPTKITPEAFDALMKHLTSAGGGYEDTGKAGDAGNFAGGPTGKGASGWSGKWKNYEDGSYHGGADFGVGVGSPVYATRNGHVTAVENLYGKSYGKYIKMSDGADDFYFAHLSSQLVKVGDAVTRGQKIGLSGDTGNSTGPHLHFEVRPKGAGHDDAIDPSKFFAMGGIVTGPTRAMIGEAGSAEAVIPLNNRGAQFMASTIKEALQHAFATPIYRGGGTSHTSDYSSNFTGEVTVVAQDPNEMARKLAQKARMQRLVRPGSSR